MNEKRTATLPQRDTHNARNLDGSKARVNSARRVVVHPDSTCPHDVRTLVDARWWMGASRNSSVVHCSVWVRDGGREFCGYGNAGGGGYHKESAALQAALDSAGITLSSPIDGYGDAAQDDALDAVADAVAGGKNWLRV